MAKPTVGAAYIEPFLDGSASSAENAAISYLGALPAYQPKLREKYLLNSEASVSTRVTAAQTLGTYDKDFGIVALTIASDPETPPMVYGEVVTRYADQAIRGGKLGKVEARALRGALENYQKGKSQSVIWSLQEVTNSLNAIIQ